MVSTGNRKREDTEETENFVLEKIPHDGLFKNAVERELLRASRNAFVAVSEPSVTLLDAPRTTEMVVVNSHALDEPMSDMPLFCN